MRMASEDVIQGTYVLEAISSCMVTNVQEHGFEFKNNQAPPMVRLVGCFPECDQEKAAETIATLAQKHVAPNEDGTYKVVVACTAIGSVHVGLIEGLVLSSSCKNSPKTPLVVFSISNGDMLGVLTKRHETRRTRDDEDDEENEDEKDQRKKTTTGGTSRRVNEDSRGGCAGSTIG